MPSVGLRFSTFSTRTGSRRQVHGRLGGVRCRGIRDRSQWQLRGPLQPGDKVRVELLNDKGERIDELSQPVEKRQVCRQHRCTLDLNSTLRAPDDALASRYQLRIGLLLAPLAVISLGVAGQVWSLWPF